MKQQITLEEAVGSKFIGSCYPKKNLDTELLLVFEEGYILITTCGGYSDCEPEVLEGDNLDISFYPNEFIINSGIMSETELREKQERDAERFKSKMKSYKDQVEAEERETYLRLKEKFEKKD